MQPFVMGHASDADSSAALERCLRGLSARNAGARATLGLVYVNETFNLAGGRLLDRMRQATGVEHWLGTVGQGVCATAREYYDQPAIAAMLVEAPPGSCQLLSSVGPDSGPGTGPDPGGGVALVHIDPSRADGGDWLERLAGLVGDALVVGGLGSPQPGSGEAELRGHSAVCFAADCEILVDHTQGCSLIGHRHTITRSFRNLIVELDRRPALEVLREEIGEVLARDLERALGYIFVALPVAGSDRGDYQVRNLTGIDLQQQVLAIGDLAAEGQPMQFARRDGNSARDDLDQMLVRLRGRAGARTPRGAVYVSCIGRGRNQFGPGAVELRALADTLGEVPLVGYFASGEIFQSRIYGYTGVLTLFL